MYSEWQYYIEHLHTYARRILDFSSCILHILLYVNRDINVLELKFEVSNITIEEICYNITNV